MNLRQSFSFIKTKLKLINKEHRGFYTTNFGGSTPQVNATVRLSDGSVVVVGDFTGYIDSTGINYKANRIIKFSSSGQVDTTFLNNIGTGFNNTVECAITDGVDLYIGGQFTSFNGILSINRIAKISLDGIFDNTFKSNNSGYSNTVRSIATTGGSLYIGGDFTSPSRIAKCTTAGVAQTFSSGIIDNNVHAVATDGTFVYVGGEFNNVTGGSLVGRIAKYSLTGTFNTAFYLSYGTGFNNTVRSIAVSGSSLYIVGSFTSFNGTANNARSIAKLSTSGAFDSAFGNNLDVVSGTRATTSGFNTAIYTVTVDGANLYVGGEFTSFKGTANNAKKIAKLSTAGVFDTAFSNNLDVVSGTKSSTSGFEDYSGNVIRSISIDGINLFVGGKFISFKNSTNNSLIKISNLGVPQNYITASTQFSTAITTAVLDSAGNRYIGTSGSGYFNGRRIGGIAKILPNGELDETFLSNIGSGFNFDVNEIVISGTNLYVGGSFTSFNGVANNANRIAKLSTSGVFDTTFSNNLDVVSGTKATTSGFGGDVYSLATDGTSLYVGGGFTSFKGTNNNANRIAKLSTSGVFDTAFSNNLDVVSGTKSSTSGFNNFVESLLIDGVDLYVGGRFTSFKGTANNARFLAKLTIAGVFNTAFSDNLDVVAGTKDITSGFGGTVLIGSIFKIITDGVSLYVGGDFTNFKGTTNNANRIAKLSKSGVFDTAFSNNLDVVSGTKSATSGFDGWINDILLQGTNLYVAGSFSSFKGTANNAPEVAKLTIAGVFDTAFSDFLDVIPGTKAATSGFDLAVSGLLYDYKYSSLVVFGGFSNFKNEAAWRLYTISLNT